ncbi:MAG: PAS domain S-box protein [Candidatus Desulfacyla sp.]
MKFGLKAKIVLITVAILTGTAGAGTLVSGYIFFDGYAAALKSRTSVIGESLASQLNHLLALGIPLNEVVGFEDQCQDILKNHEGISHAMVVDPDGRILFHNEPSRHGEMLTDSRRLEAIRDDRGDLLTQHEQGTKYYESLLPIFGDDGRHIGEVIIGFPAGVVSEETKRLVIYSTGIALVFLGVAVILLIAALSSWVTGPLAQLLDAIQGVRNKGPDFAGRVEIASRDEIGELGSAFNEMTEGLQQTTVSRDYLDTLIEGMMDTLIVVGPDGIIRTANQAVCRLLGYTRDELIGHPVSKILEADEWTHDGAELVDLIEGKRVGERIRRYRAKDNTLVPVLFGASAVKDADGAIRHIVCTGRDISERMRAEEALRESEERYRDIVEYSQVMLYTHDLEGRTLSVNSFAAEQLGYNTAELLRMNIRDLIVPERRAEFDRYLAEIETEATSRGLILLQTAKGEKRLWEYNNTLRTEGVPRPIVRGMAYDVTDQKREEKERENLIQELQTALSEVRKLSGMLPICASCKKIRNDQGYWQQVEQFVSLHTGARFSHGLCPECGVKLYGDLLSKKDILPR